MKIITYVRIDNKEPVLWDSLSEQEQQRLVKKMVENSKKTVAQILSDGIQEGTADKGLLDLLK